MGLEKLYASGIKEFDPAAEEVELAAGEALRPALEALETSFAQEGHLTQDMLMDLGTAMHRDCAAR
jgi:hypothetical protein